MPSLARPVSALRSPCRRLLAPIAAAIGVALCTQPAPAHAATTDRTERVEVTLNAARLPAADRERLADRAQSIADAIASGVPLWRSFDPREVLHDTLAALGAAGADVGETAIVNFDLLELDVPTDDRAKLERLGFVRSVDAPTLATPSGSFDSDGLAAIGSDVANLAGLTGSGIKVAVIDSEWESLAAVIAAGDLPAIPVTMQFRVTTAGTVTANVAADGFGDREHGTAAAEVVHEVAPGATLLLYRLNYDGNGAVSAAAIKAAIRSAADQGAKVILAPVHFIKTMSDPRGIAAGGTNPFTDDIDYATAAGATVVVPAGNEALRHYSGKYTACDGCTTATLCNTADNDQIFHVFEDDLPLNDIVLDTDYDDFAYGDGETFSDVRITCYSATDAVTPSNFKMQLIRYRDLYSAVDPPDFPTCPRDAGADLVDGTETTLGGSFTKNITPYGGSGLNLFEDSYFIAVKRMTGTERPNFRIDCTIGVGEMTYSTTERSLSDLAVVSSSLSVAGTVEPAYDTVSDVSSQGPSGDPNGPIKPDLSGPSEVINAAARIEAFTFWETFNGTSAAASHVAGVVALVQGYRQSEGLPPYTPAEIKQVLQGSAIELDDGLPGLVGPDPIYGYGLVQIPAAILPGVPGSSTAYDRDADLMVDPATYDPATGNWAWLGSTAGQSGISGFGGGSLLPVSGDFDGDGKIDAATYDPSSGDWTFDTTTTVVPSATGLGGGGFRPFVGDYDGDGKIDPGVYDETTGNWKWRRSSNLAVDEENGFGGPGRAACPADFDGDGQTDLATFEKATGKWQYLGSTEGAKEFTFSPGSRWMPMPADFDGDGKADAATFQKKKGKWRMRLSSLGGLTAAVTGIGNAGWVPVSGDWDGDGKADPAAYRKSTGVWRWMRSSDGETEQVTFGGSGVTPMVAQRP